MDSFSPLKSNSENMLFFKQLSPCQLAVQETVMYHEKSSGTARRPLKLSLFCPQHHGPAQVEMNSWRFHFSWLALCWHILGYYSLCATHTQRLGLKRVWRSGWLKSRNVMEHLYHVLTLFAQKLNYAWCSGCFGLGKRCESIGYAVKTGVRCRQAFKNKQNLRSGNMYPRRLADVESRLTGQLGTNRHSPSQRLPL